MLGEAFSRQHSGGLSKHRRDAPQLPAAQRRTPETPVNTRPRACPEVPSRGSERERGPGCACLCFCSRPASLLGPSHPPSSRQTGGKQPRCRRGFLSEGLPLPTLLEFNTSLFTGPRVAPTPPFFKPLSPHNSQRNKSVQ